MAKEYGYKKQGKGVPKGYRHNWKYTGRWSEIKTGPGKWRISFRATKGKRARGFGSFKKGFRIKWKINAVQHAIKTGKGTYQTHLIGTKKRLRSGYQFRICNTQTE